MVDKPPPERRERSRDDVLESRPKARLPDIGWSDPLTTLPKEAEGDGEQGERVRSKIGLQDEVVGVVPSDEEKVPMVQDHGKKTRSDVMERYGLWVIADLWVMGCKSLPTNLVDQKIYGV
jgi:hypothetical protein